MNLNMKVSLDFVAIKIIWVRGLQDAHARYFGSRSIQVYICNQYIALIFFDWRLRPCLCHGLNGFNFASQTPILETVGDSTLFGLKNTRFIRVTWYQVNFCNDDFVHHLLPLFKTVRMMKLWIIWADAIDSKNDTFAKIHSARFEQLHEQKWWQCETVPSWCRYLCLICVAVRISWAALDGQTWYPRSTHCFGNHNGDGLPVQLRYVDFCAKNSNINDVSEHQVRLPLFCWEGS